MVSEVDEADVAEGGEDCGTGAEAVSGGAMEEGGEVDDWDDAAGGSGGWRGGVGHGG